MKKDFLSNKKISDISGFSKTEDSSRSDSFLAPPTEKDFIRLFSEIFQLKNKPLLSGSEFDDCAALALKSFCRDLAGESLTFSTDTVRESSDFPKGMTYWQKGWMAAAVNLSDLAAMGSIPIAFLFSVGFPRETTLKEAEFLAKGIQDCVSFFGAEVIGGDTEFCDELTVTGTVVGLSNNKELILRKNAKPGDLLCVTGNVGSAGVALAVLLNQIQANASESFLKNLTEPFPRIFEGQMLAKTNAVTSMIDTSDGLASSIYELSSLSGIGFEIDESKLPIETEAKTLVLSSLKNSNAMTEHALYSGGDYELLFTVSPNRLEDVKNAFSNFNKSADRFKNLISTGKTGRFPCSFTVIGKAINEKENVIVNKTDNSQTRRPLLKKGYDSFQTFI